jgi:hypothetical protein
VSEVVIPALYGSAVKMELVRHNGTTVLSLTTEHMTKYRCTVFLDARQTTQMLDWVLAGTEPE